MEFTLINKWRACLSLTRSSAQQPHDPCVRVRKEDGLRPTLLKATRARVYSVEFTSNSNTTITGLDDRNLSAICKIRERNIYGLI